MPYVKPDAVVDSMIQAGINKGKLGVKDLLIRGALSGAFLGFATTLALTGTAQTGVGLIGALIFPVGFVMIVLLGLELVTGNFAVVPLGVMERKITISQMGRNWGLGFYRQPDWLTVLCGALRQKHGAIRAADQILDHN